MVDGAALAPFASTLLWVVFTAACALSTVLGLILAYHWIRFSMNPVVPLIAIISYIVGSVLFLFAMFVAAIAL